MKKQFPLLILFFILLVLIFIFSCRNNFKESMDSNKKYTIGPSDIHGRGVICKQKIAKNEKIDIAFIFNKGENNAEITPDFGKYINHKKEANANVYTEDDNIYYIVANKDIFPNEEITANYDGKDIPIYISGSLPEYKQ